MIAYFTSSHIFKFAALLAVVVLLSSCRPALPPPAPAAKNYESAVEEARDSSERAVLYAEKARKEYEEAKKLYLEMKEAYGHILAASNQCSEIKALVDKKKRCVIIRGKTKEQKKDEPKPVEKKEVIEYSPSDAPF